MSSRCLSTFLFDWHMPSMCQLQKWKVESDKGIFIYTILYSSSWRLALWPAHTAIFGCLRQKMTIMGDTVQALKWWTDCETGSRTTLMLFWPRITWVWEDETAAPAYIYLPTNRNTAATSSSISHQYSLNQIYNPCQPLSQSHNLVHTPWFTILFCTITLQ